VWRDSVDHEVSLSFRWPDLTAHATIGSVTVTDALRRARIATGTLHAA
jgi:hypothetical protein